MAKFLLGTLWVTVVRHCHRMKAHEKKWHENVLVCVTPGISHCSSCSCFISLVRRILKSVLCSSHTLIVFLACTHNRRNSWFLQHSFRQIVLSSTVRSLKNGTCRHQSEVQTRAVITQRYQFSYELLPGRNFLEQELIGSCKNDLCIYPCNQETNAIVLICSTFILDDSSTWVLTIQK